MKKFQDIQFFISLIYTSIIWIIIVSISGFMVAWIYLNEKFCWYAKKLTELLTVLVEKEEERRNGI